MIQRCWPRLSLLFAIKFIALTIEAGAESSNATEVTHAPLSGCQVCAESGDCSHAYLDAPGQFCGNWLDRASRRQRCCCPREATCQVSNYVCSCRTSTAKQRTSAPSTTASQSSSIRLGTTIGSALLLFLASALLWCLCPCCRARRYTRLSQSMTPVVVEAPMYAQPYVAGPGYRHAYGPGYGPVYGGGGYTSGGMGAGSSAMLGGAAGFFGGMMLGQTMSHSGDGGHHGYNEGSCYAADNGGGQEFGGDF